MPTGPSIEDLKKIASNKRVIHLSKKSKRFTKEIRNNVGYVTQSPRNHPLVIKKAKVDAALVRKKSRLRDKLLDKAPKRHFRNADTDALDAQFADTDGFDAEFAMRSSSTPTLIQETEPAKPLKYNILERGIVVQLTCEPNPSLTYSEKYEGSIKVVMARVALCDRQETRRCRKPKTIKKVVESKPATLIPEVKDLFPAVCRLTQCIFCISNEGYSIVERTFEYSRPNKMMNHVENMHFPKYGQGKVKCEHPLCKETDLTLPSVIAFKNHAAREHKIFLRV